MGNKLEDPLGSSFFYLFSFQLFLIFNHLPLNCYHLFKKKLANPLNIFFDLLYLGGQIIPKTNNKFF